MNNRKKSTRSVTEVHRPLLNLLQCPAIHMKKSHTVKNKKSHIRKALIIGLLVGMSSFAALYLGTENISFSIIAGVVAGIFATYLSHAYLNKKSIYEDLQTNISNLQTCPVAGRFKLSDNGFFGPRSITWKTGTDPSLLIASVGAGILQMLHHKVVLLIEQSGKVYRDPKGRGERTGLHARSIIYGDIKIAEAAAEALKQIHDAQRAQDPETGEWYSANKPELLLWVHNSLTWMILRTFKMYGPSLTSKEEDQFVQEQHISGKLAGLEIKMLPANTKELNAYMDGMIDQLSLTKDSIRFRNFFLKKDFPHSLTDAIRRLFVSASMRRMSPVQRKLYDYQSSKLSDITVQSVASIMIRILRYVYPANKMIPKTREELTKHSFGSHLLKK